MKTRAGNIGGRAAYRTRGCSRYPSPMSQPVQRILLCPYCGELQPPAQECRACGGCLDEWSLKATQNDMGCWFVRDPRRPHFVGFSHQALIGAIRAGEIGMNAIVRGPTTRQFWTIARRVPGLAHLFGRCYACQAPVSEENPRCAQCGGEPPALFDRNQFGLGAIDRVAPPADARPDLSAFIEDTSTLLVRVSPVVAPPEIPEPTARPFVPAAVSVKVRPEPEFEPAVSEAAAVRSALTPVHLGLASRARSLERTNRLLFGFAAISFLVAVGLVLFMIGQGERQRRETDAKVSEAIRAVRSEFERKAPVVIPPPAELPPMPNAPTSPPTPK